MKKRNKKERISYAMNLFNQRDELTEQLLKEINKDEPDEAKITEILMNRDDYTREMSIELDFLRNLDWLKETMCTIGVGTVLAGALTLVKTKLIDN